MNKQILCLIFHHNNSNSINNPENRHINDDMSKLSLILLIILYGSVSVVCNNIEYLFVAKHAIVPLNMKNNDITIVDSIPVYLP